MFSLRLMPPWPVVLSLPDVLITGSVVPSSGKMRVKAAPIVVVLGIDMEFAVLRDRFVWLANSAWSCRLTATVSRSPTLRARGSRKNVFEPGRQRDPRIVGDSATVLAAAMFC